MYLAYFLFSVGGITAYTSSALQEQYKHFVFAIACVYAIWASVAEMHGQCVTYYC